jgi:hypothetical protein
LGYLGILDFIHLLSYVYGIAMAIGRDADDGWQRYVTWITALWNGEATDVLAQWRALAEEFDVPLDQALPDNDPRRPIQRALTYLENNLDRVRSSLSPLGITDDLNVDGIVGQRV